MRLDQKLWLIFQIIILQACISHTASPPLVERPALLDSFIPASMQILAHLTELMKYDTKPPKGSTTTSSPPYGSIPTVSTVRPTLPHRPAIYAPSKPLGPAYYFANQRHYSYREYLERLKQPSGLNYFDRYQIEPASNSQGPYFKSFDDEQEIISRELHSRSLDDGGTEIPAELYLYFGVNFTDLLRLANKLEPVEIPNNNIETQVYEFTKQFDDKQLRIEYNKKQVPPTRAYVTLLSLYDLLSKESKRLSLNKYQGFTDAVLYELIQSSQSTSVYQLKFILSKIVDRQDTRDANIMQKIKELLTDIDEKDSYINLATKHIPPLVFAP